MKWLLFFLALASFPFVSRIAHRTRFFPIWYLFAVLPRELLRFLVAFVLYGKPTLPSLFPRKEGDGWTFRRTMLRNPHSLVVLPYGLAPLILLFASFLVLLKFPVPVLREALAFILLYNGLLSGEELSSAVSVAKTSPDGTFFWITVFSIVLFINVARMYWEQEKTRWCVESSTWGWWVAGIVFFLMVAFAVLILVNYYLLRKKAIYTVEGKPCIKARVYPEVISELDRVFERGKDVSFPPSDRFSVWILKKDGEEKGELWFHPEAFNLIKPEELVAKLSGVDLSEVETFEKSKETFISGGRHALFSKKELTLEDFSYAISYAIVMLFLFFVALLFSIPVLFFILKVS